MRYSRFVGAALLLGVGLVAWSGHAALAAGKTTLKVHVPQSDATLWIDGKEIAGEGTVRDIPAPKLKPGKNAYTLRVLWEPNNYTKIWRERKVKPSAGEVVVDLRENLASDLKDHIEVRWVPTPEDIVAEMCKLAKVGKKDVVFDLGCGDGVMVVTAVEKFGAKRGVGVDIKDEMVRKARKKAKEHGVADKLTFKIGDVLKTEPKDVADATVVLLYMGDDINNRLKPILKKGLKPGSRVVSHRFTMGDWKPQKTIHITGADMKPYDLHLWVIGADEAKESKGKVSKKE